MPSTPAPLPSAPPLLSPTASAAPDALSAPKPTLPLSLLTRLACYAGGWLDAARIARAPEGMPQAIMISHWLERNARGYRQAVENARMTAVQRMSAVGGELAGMPAQLDALAAELQRAEERLREIEVLPPITAADVLRYPGELRLEATIVETRRLRKRESERAARLAAVEAARVALDRSQRRADELVAAIRVGVDQLLTEVELLRAFFQRRAEIAARGIAHYGTRAAWAAGVLTDDVPLEPPAWNRTTLLTLLVPPRFLHDRSEGSAA